MAFTVSQPTAPALPELFSSFNAPASSVRDAFIISLRQMEEEEPRDVKWPNSGLAAVVGSAGVETGLPGSRVWV